MKHYTDAELDEIDADPEKLCRYLWEVATYLRKIGMLDQASRIVGCAHKLAEKLENERIHDTQSGS